MPLFDYSVGPTFGTTVTRQCRGKRNWDVEDRTGEYFGMLTFDNRSWAVVLWSGEEEPSLCKAEAIQVEEQIWKNIV